MGYEGNTQDDIKINNLKKDIKRSLLKPSWIFVSTSWSFVKQKLFLKNVFSKIRELVGREEKTKDRDGGMPANFISHIFPDKLFA